MARDDDLDTILRAVDSPIRAPEDFRSGLLQELRDAHHESHVAHVGGHDIGTASRASIEMTDSGEPAAEILSLELLGETPGRRPRLGAAILAVAAAVALMAVLVLPRNGDSEVNLTGDPAPPTVTTTTVPSLSPSAACIELLAATQPLADLSEVASDDASTVVADLLAWRDALDLLLAQSGTFLSADEEADMLQARVLIRQAIDAPSTSTVVAIERYWREATADGPLAACRRTEE